MDAKRGYCHESGHTTVGLSRGFHVAGIDVFEGRLRTICELDANDRSDMDRFIFLAGGIAGEKVGLGNFDHGGCGDDQEKITERGGQSIEMYLADAAKIIESKKECFQELRKKIAIRVIEKRMERSISGGGNTFKLLSGDEIQQIWSEKGGT
jgi:hypothetical protein